MAETKATPTREWHVELQHGLPIIVDADGRKVAEIVIAGGIGQLRGVFADDIKAVIAANARLLSAAPDLLDAAKLADLNFRRARNSELFDDDHEAWTALRAAIAKAEGKP